MKRLSSRGGLEKTHVAIEDLTDDELTFIGAVLFVTQMTTPTVMSLLSKVEKEAITRNLLMQNQTVDEWFEDALVKTNLRIETRAFTTSSITVFATDLEIVTDI
jgi:hypothetical protein